MFDIYFKMKDFQWKKIFQAKIDTFNILIRILHDYFRTTVNWKVNQNNRIESVCNF